MAQQVIEQDPITNVASRLRTATVWLIPVPEGASPQERRTYHMAGIGLPVGLFTHAFLVFLFAYWGVPEMALFNVLSVFLWGDAVNTASRMESHGSGGRIQITRATYDLIKNDFSCEPQGTVDVKGKGEMDVWYVTGVINS